MLRAPIQARVPHLSILLDDLAHVPPKRLAAHLGVSLRTLQRWRADGQAPRAVMLALFWESRWGRDLSDCDAVNWATIQASRAALLERRCAHLLGVIHKLEHEISGHCIAANAPFLVA